MRPIAKKLSIALMLVSASVFPRLHAQLTSSQPRPKGRLVIEGGPKTPRHEAIYQAMLDGRQGSGPLCIIPTATVDPDSAIAAELKAFGGHGWGTDVVGIPITPEHAASASDPKIVADLQRCSGFFFTGGRQIRSSHVFRPSGATTPALETIKARYREGAVVGGTSAGASIMSDPMINAGTGVSALARGVGPGGVAMIPGLGFFSGELVDQHFLVQNRIGRLLVAVLQIGAYKTAYGIDENTALVVQADRAWVVGASGVVFIDGRQSKRATSGNGGSGLLLSLVGAGDTIDLQSHRIRVNSAKKPLATDSSVVAPPGDIFAKWEFLHLLHGLGRSTARGVIAPAGDYDLVIEKEPGFAAVSFDTPGVQGTPEGLSVGPFRVDVRRRAP